MGGSVPNSKGYSGTLLTAGMEPFVPFAERVLHPPKKMVPGGGPVQTTTILSNAPTLPQNHYADMLRGRAARLLPKLKLPKPL
jgi:hypothetical protein